MAFAALEGASSAPALLLAALCSTSTALGIVHLARRRRYPLLDVPHADYKRQPAPVPLAGALCLLAATPALALTNPIDPRWQRAWLGLGLLVALAAGLDDDRRKARGAGSPWPVKLLGQIAAAGCVAAAGPQHSPWLTLAWLVLCMNAWNFLDNSNGVAAATVLGASVPWLCPGASPLVLVPCGAMLGFLPWNWPRARVFLGDGGSQGLGLVLGCVSLELLPCGPIVFLAPHAVALFDLVQVVVVRLGLGLPPWRGDRRHLAHRLQRSCPGPAVAPCFFAAQAIVSLLVAGGVPGRQ